MLTLMEGQMRYLAPPLEGLLRTLIQREELSPLRFLEETRIQMEEGTPFSDAFAESLSSCASELALSEGDIRPLVGLGPTLGTTDVSGQLAAIELCQTEILRNLESARVDNRTRGSLYRKLGMLTGLALVVIFL